MSVLTVLVRPDNYALMGCDGVATDPHDGSVVGYMQKIRTYPAMNCAVGITGVGGFDAIMDWFMPIWVKDFDDLVDVLAITVLRTFEFLVDNGMIRFEDPRCSICAAGWSEKAQAFKAYRVVTYPKKSQNTEGETITLEPWTALEMQHSGTWSSTDAGREAMQKCGVYSSPDDDDIAMMTRIICSARQGSGIIEHEEMSGTFNAGGYVQLALIQRGQISSWIPHRWPEDIIGEPIDPTRGDIIPQYLVKDAG